MIKSIFKVIKRVLNDNSRLAPHRHILKQNNRDKLRRLVFDQADPLAQPSWNNILLLLERYLPQISPISNVGLIWGLIVFLSIMYYYIEMGIVLTFGEVVWDEQLANPVTLTLDIVTISIFGLDVLFRVSCGYICRGVIILKASRISKYLRGQFVLDVINIVILIVVINSNNYAYNWGKLWLLLKISRCYEIDANFMRRLYSNKIGKTIYVLAKLMTLLFLASHIIGLIFYAMDNYLLTSRYYQPQLTWLTTSTAYTPITSLDWPLQYLYSLYWGLNQVTTISYCDITPLNPIETAYHIPIMWMGFVLYGYATENIIRLIIWARQHGTLQLKQTIEIENYMRNVNVRQDVRERVLGSLQQTYDQRDYDLENEMKSKLPPNLQRAVAKQLYRGFYSSLIHIFLSQDITQCLLGLDERKYGSNQVIVQRGMHPCQLYFISEGNLFSQLLLVKTGVLLRELTSNTLFGQYQLFNNKAYGYQYRTATTSTIYQISSTRIFQAIHSSTYLKQKLQIIIHQIIFNKAYNLIQHSCYFCHSNHHFTQCPQRFPRFSLPSKQPSIHNLDANKRYGRPKLNALKLKLNYTNNQQPKRSAKLNLLIKIHSKVREIKNRVKLIQDQFQVDSAFDWNIFYPHSNLAKAKQLWNLSNYHKKLSNRSI